MIPTPLLALSVQLSPDHSALLYCLLRELVVRFGPEAEQVVSRTHALLKCGAHEELVFDDEN